MVYIQNYNERAEKTSYQFLNTVSLIVPFILVLHDTNAITNIYLKIKPERRIKYQTVI